MSAWQVVLTCGHPDSGYQMIHDELVRSGLDRAHPSDRDISPPSKDSRNRKFPTRALHELAIDLFNANSSDRAWGWADAGALSMLNFWKNFDSRIHFVLVYTTPESTVSRMLETASETSDGYADAINSWVAYNTELLRFYNCNPDRCILVNATSVIKDPVRFIASVSVKLGMRLGLNSHAHQTAPMTMSMPINALIRAIIGNDHPAVALYRELESSADVHDESASLLDANDDQSVWQEFRSILQKLQSSMRVEQERHMHDAGLQAERDTLRQALSDALGQAHELEVQLSDAKACLEETQVDAGQLKSRTETLAQENDILQFQVLQMKEELEHYIVKCKSLQFDYGIALERLEFQGIFLRDQITNAVIDMRKEFEGENWHNTEPDGRWAGPNKVSYIRIPALAQGSYKGLLDITGCIDTDILSGMSLFLNGETLPIKIGSLTCPTQVAFKFSTAQFSDPPFWEFLFKFPKVVSPAHRGSGDTRDLAIKVRTMTLNLSS